MDAKELAAKAALENAVIDTFHNHKMKILDGEAHSVVAKLSELGVTASHENGYLELKQADGTPVVLSAACERIRKDHATLFIPDPKRDAVTSREDLERGSAQDIARAKAAYIKANPNAWETLPQTRAQAEKKAIVPSTETTRAEYLQLPRSDKARLSALGPDVIGKIMSRR